MLERTKSITDAYGNAKKVLRSRLSRLVEASASKRSDVVLGGPTPAPNSAPLFPLETESPEYLRNRRNSRLYTIPHELLLLIAEHLPPTAMIALRLSARHFHHIFENPQELEPYEQRKFAQLMQEDSFGWNCRRERAFGIGASEKAVCGSCRCLHPKADFAAPQLVTEDPAKRRCRGAHGLVWICSHAAFSFDEVAALAQTTIAAGRKEMSDFRICTHPDHGIRAQDLALSAPIAGVKWNGAQATFVMSRSISIMQLPGPQIPTREALVGAVVALKEIVCPHVRMSDYNDVLPPRKPLQHGGSVDNYPFFISRLDTAPRHCASGACSVCSTVPRHCPKSDCDTSWVLFRRHNRADAKRDEIVCSITRNIRPGFGLEHKPCERSWTSQIASDDTSPQLESCKDGQTFFSTHAQDIDPLLLYFRTQGFLETRSYEDLIQYDNIDDAYNSILKKLRYRYVSLEWRPLFSSR